MKIKLDFITNSSSTTYVVCIPNDFVIDVPDFIDSEYYEETIDDEEDLTEDIVLKGLNLILDKLRTSGMIWEDDTILDTQVPGLHIMSDIMEKNDFVINAIDSGSDDGKIIYLTDKQIEKIMKLKSGELLQKIKVVDHEDKA
jgi:hypothetical protein